MQRFRLCLLGTFHAVVDDCTLQRFASDKERALLAYLALEAHDRPVRREVLAQMFWAGYTRDTARHSLRNALYHLRQLLAPLDLLDTSRQSVRLVAGHPDVWCDVRALGQVAGDETASLQQVQEALSLVRGKLLQGLELDECPAFTTWLAEQRELLAAQIRRLEEKRTTLLAAIEAIPRRGFLPRALTPLFGRQQDLDLLAQKLVDPDYDLVTIAGEGGIGKTRLALAVAEKVRDDFPGGVWFVPLQRLDTNTEAGFAATDPHHLPNLLVMEIAKRLSIRFEPRAPLVDQLVQNLAGPRLLLVLDNFEHLAGVEPLLVELLQGVPNLCLLVTSRHRLRLQAEYYYRLRGLPTPPLIDGAGGPAMSIADLQGYASVQLLVERAGRGRSSFTLDAQNAEAVGRICQLVDGLPLGIELAAVLLDRYTGGEVARGIEATVDVLASNMSDLPPQHRSLRTVFEYSWRLLSLPEQLALAHCAIFRGGFTEEAAQAVACCQPETVASLVDKSLVRQDPTGRYDMHELLRQLAAEKLLDEPGSRQAATMRHCRHYARFLHARETGLTNNPALLEEVRAEVHNLLLAWQTAVRQPYPAALRQMLRGLVQLWYSRGVSQYAIAQLGEAASALRAELATADEVEEIQAVLGRVLVEQARLVEWQGQKEKTLALIEEILDLGRKLEDGYLQASGYLHLALAYWTLNRLKEAEEAARLGLENAQRIGDMRLIGTGLAGLSIILRSQGQIEASLLLDEQAVQWAKTSGETANLAVLLGNLGAGYSLAGNFQKARDRLDRSLEIRRQNQDQLGVATCLLHLGRLSLILGDVPVAQQLLDQALAVFKDASSDKSHAEALANRALTHLALKNYEAAHQDARQALDQAAAVSNCAGMVMAHLALSKIWLAQGQPEPALDAARTAVDLSADVQDGETLLPAQAALALLLLRQGDQQAAREVVQQMLPLPDLISFRPILGTVDAHLVASQVLASEDPDQALAILRHVHQRLLAAAATIDVPAVRHGFLHDVPTHRQILAQIAAHETQCTLEPESALHFE